MSFLCDSYRVTATSNSFLTPIFCQPTSSPARNFSWASSALRSLSGEKSDDYSPTLSVAQKSATEKPPLPPLNSESSDGQITNLNFASKQMPIATTSVSPSKITNKNAQPTAARRSLSAQYLEAKKATESVNQKTQFVKPIEQNVVSEQTTLSTDATELDQEENTSISSLDSLDVVEEIADYEQESMFATDHGPVRHSLINLVLQEDLPELLQAMSEDLHFVFDDYSSSGSQAMNGILQKRRPQSQKRVRDNNRICFAESPKVFTYLNENAALMEGQWLAGRHIPYEEYLKLCQDTQDQAARQAMELSKWRAVMQMKYTDRDDALNSTTTQLSQTSLQPPQLSPSTSRTPTPDDLERLGASPTSSTRFLYGRPIMRQEVGSSAI